MPVAALGEHRAEAVCERRAVSPRVERRARAGLSGASLRVLYELEREHEENGGWPVSTRTLVGRTGLRSKASVHWHLAILVAAGLAERGPGRFDGWRPRG
jgi:DNA-binding MarR family transcriptional regulator